MQQCNPIYLKFHSYSHLCRVGWDDGEMQVSSFHNATYYLLVLWFVHYFGKITTSQLSNVNPFVALYSAIIVDRLKTKQKNVQSKNEQEKNRKNKRNQRHGLISQCLFVDEKKHNAIFHFVIQIGCQDKGVCVWSQCNFSCVERVNLSASTRSENTF